jgi:tetratricopeptide (TPR) repeat protein
MKKQLLHDVLNLAGKYCGGKFTQNLLVLCKERERVLNSIWKKESLPEELSDGQKDNLLRNIDFDTIIFQAGKCLLKSDYLLLLNEIAVKTIQYGEFKRGKETLFLILKITDKKDQDSTAEVLRKLGNIEFYTNNFTRARKYFDKSLSLFTKVDNKLGIVSIKNVLGAVLVEEGRFYEGEIHLIQARKIATESKFSDLIARINMNLGNIYNMRGSTEDAINCYQKALSANHDNNQDLLSIIYMNFAIAYKFMQDYKKAGDYLDKVQEINKQINNCYQKGLFYLTKAEVACLQGELSVATAFVTSAFAIFTEIGDRLSIADAYKILGMVNRRNKNFDIALSYFENSKRIYEMITNPINLAETLVEMAKLYVDMGDQSLAKKVIKKAIKNFQKIGGDRKVEYTRNTFRNLI